MFRVSVSKLDPWPIRPGDAVQVLLDSVPVVTGYVDKLDGVKAKDSDTHTLTVSGRDKTADLIDCCVVHGPGEYRGLTLAQIAKQISAPFGIEVVVEADVGASFPRLAVQPGDTAWATLEMACRARGVLTLSDGRGRLVLAAPKARRSSVALVEGKNLKSVSWSLDESQRFSLYVVKGQNFGSDDVYGVSAASVSATSTDSGVRRYRPLVVLAENAGDIAYAKRRAGWEATVRSARAGTVQVVVPGWEEDAGGHPWDINSIVSCSLPSAGVAGDMLLSAVEFSKSLQNGTVSTLSLTRPDAFAVEPESPDAETKRGGDPYARLFEGSDD